MVKENYHTTQPINDGIKCQLGHIKEKWCHRLTGSGIREIDELSYVKGKRSIQHMALAYKDTLITSLPNKTGTDIWPDMNPREDSNHIRQAFARLKIMAQAYCTSICHETYRDEFLYQATFQGLSRMMPYYQSGMEVDGNWWNFDIGGPQALNDALLLLSHRLRETVSGNKLLEHYIAATAYYVPIPEKVRRTDNKQSNRMTGANLADTAIVCLIRGLLSGNLKDIENAGNAAKTILPYVRVGDGFYEDGSFIQHNIIPYAGGYGPDLIRSFENLIYLLNNTDYALQKAEGFHHISSWIQDAYLPLFKDGEIMDMVRGRKSSRFNDTAHRAGRRVLSTLLLLAEYVPDYAKAEIRSEIKGLLERDYVCKDILCEDMSAYNAEIIKTLLESNESSSSPRVTYKTYGNMDRVVQHRKKFSLGISMFSSRIGRFTFGNDENREGHHTCDGMLYLYTDDPFQFCDGFWPTIDKMRLPGITSDHLKPTVQAWFDNRNTKDWVGGSDVDGQYGSVGMDMEMAQPSYPQESISKAEPSDLTGKKSWFVFEDEIICLGAGICSTSSDRVETIVENRRVDNTGSLYSPEGEIKLSDGATITFQKPWLVLEGNQVESGRSEPIGYYFPGKQKINVLKETRVGAWSDINGDGPDTPLQRTYTSIAFDHGARPLNATYAYVLLPGKDSADMEAYASAQALEILSNTQEIQAVTNKVSGLSGMNFWCAGEIAGVQAQMPCSVTKYEPTGSDSTISLGISDPTHKQEYITLILDGKYTASNEPEPGRTVTYSNGKTEITVDTGNKDGASQNIRIQRWF